MHRGLDFLVGEGAAGRLEREAKGETPLTGHERRPGIEVKQAQAPEQRPSSVAQHALHVAGWASRPDHDGQVSLDGGDAGEGHVPPRDGNGGL